MKVCIAYDCLFPWTVGGAERWYRRLAERLATDGYDVTYLTMRQWDDGDVPDIPGVRVIAVARRRALYTQSGRRRIAPPLLFALGLLAHLLVHRRRYDLVHTASFPFFHILAIGAVRAPLVVDWFECWDRPGWRDYLGWLAPVGAAVQHCCLRIRQQPLCYSEVARARLREAGGVEPHLLRGLHEQLPGQKQARREADVPPVAVFVGRHIASKRVGTLLPALRVARQTYPDLRLVVFGDGPLRRAFEAQVRELRLEHAVRVMGFAPASVVADTVAGAACLVLPSRREGYGLVVVEASALGCPSVVVAARENAAVELIDDGVNGAVAASASPEDLGAALVRALAAGTGMRRATARWYDGRREELSIQRSFEAVEAIYQQMVVPAA